LSAGEASATANVAIAADDYHQSLSPNMARTLQTINQVTVQQVSW